MSHNRFSFIGNLTKAPDLQPVSAGKSVAKISIAVNQVRGSGESRKEHTDFFLITLWEQQAVNAHRYLDTGSKVFVAGRVETRTFEKGGERRYATDFIASEIEYLGGGAQGIDRAKSINGDPGDKHAADSDEDLSGGFAR